MGATILAVLDRQLGPVADIDLPQRAECFSEQSWLKTVPTSYPQFRLGNVVKTNGHFPGLLAEQEPWLWRLELRAVQRKMQ